MDSYKGMIQRADMCEYKRDWAGVVRHLYLALELKPVGGITHKMLRQRIIEAQEAWIDELIEENKKFNDKFENDEATS